MIDNIFELYNQPSNGTADGIEIIVNMAKKQEIDPWNIDIVQLTDKYLQQIVEMKQNNLRLTGRTLFFAAFLLRLKSDILEGIDSMENEDELIALIKALPKEYYPYIGPYLHTLPSMPDKVLNMPGIKETKNTFPKRIAPQLQGIEDLEFLSPYLYILLMPEMWPSNNKNIEMPSMRPAQIPPIKYEPNFYADVLQNTPKQGFGGLARTDNKPGADKLRTLHATESSPLTSVDIKAFLNTLDRRTRDRYFS